MRYEVPILRCDILRLVTFSAAEVYCEKLRDLLRPPGDLKENAAVQQVGSYRYGLVGTQQILTVSVDCPFCVFLEGVFFEELYCASVA